MSSEVNKQCASLKSLLLALPSKKPVVSIRVDFDYKNEEFCVVVVLCSVDDSNEQHGFIGESIELLSTIKSFLME